MSKNKQIILTTLTVVLGAVLGFVIVFAAVLGSLIAGLYEEELGVLTAILIVCGLSVPLGFLHIRINKKLRLPHWALIAITCTAPIIYSVYDRVKFLDKVEHGGFSGFMGGLGQGISDWMSMGSIFASIGFLAARIAAVCIIKHSRNSKKQ